MTRAVLQAVSATQGMQRELGQARAESAVIKRLIKRSPQPGCYACQAAPPWDNSTLTERPILARRVIKRLIIGLAPTCLSSIDADWKQVYTTGPSVSLPWLGVIKRLIIGLQTTPSWSSITSTIGADEEVLGLPAQAAGSTCLVENLLHRASARIVHPVVVAAGRELRALPVLCAIKHLIIAPPGNARDARGFLSWHGDAERDNFPGVDHVIKYLIPPGPLPTGATRSHANSPTTEPCSAGFSRFWGTNLQGSSP